ncbi:MAG: DNA polymerase III subunit delta' [Candidatus Omnitrophota bacterium]|jgi:DNA polymerase-3 subunit delta'|nr:MAG: DNA polymerase III subunit delta' [Candidatus Omnitrophota bacterium]
MSFNEIKGQSRAISVLLKHLESGRISGGYIFSGPEGVGKKAVALALAKALNCQQNKSGCSQCVSCLKIKNSQHPDVHVISSADSGLIKIEDIRSLRNDIYLKPYEAKKKIFIIDDAHNLTAEAENALLKVLEEPPPNSLIILITSKPGMLFKTVISRCKTIRFSPMDNEVITEILRKEHGVEEEAARSIAVLSSGRLGYALAIKDSPILSQRKHIIDMFVGKKEFDMDFLPLESKEEMKLMLSMLLSLFRDIYLIKSDITAGLLNAGMSAELRGLAGQYELTELDQIISDFADSFLFIEQNINRRIIISNLRLAICKKTYS